jgi:integrase
MTITISKELTAAVKNEKFPAAAAIVRNIKRKGVYSAGLGLQLEVGKNGRNKSYRYRYSVNKKDLYEYIGPAHTISLATAVERARECRELRLNGIDPKQHFEKKRLHEEEVASKYWTFADCVLGKKDAQGVHHPGYCERKLEKGEWDPRTEHASKLRIAKHLMPKLGKLPVTAIDGKKCFEVLEPICRRRPSQSKTVRGHLIQILDWATAPAQGFRDPDIPNPARWDGPLDQDLTNVKNRKIKGHNSLPAEQLIPFYHRLKAFRYQARSKEVVSDGESLNGLLVRFILLTGVREKQARLACWDHIDLDAGIWTSPPSQTKTGKKTGEEHTVYLSPPALELLKTMEVRPGAPKGKYVFVYGDADIPRLGQHMVGKPLGRNEFADPSGQLIKFVQQTLQRPDLTVAGLRDSFASWAGDHYPEMEFAIEKCLGHKVGGQVRNAYRRHSGHRHHKEPDKVTLIKQQRFLMDAWGALFEPTTKRIPKPDSNVVPLRAGN